MVPCDSESGYPIEGRGLGVGPGEGLGTGLDCWLSVEFEFDVGPAVTTTASDGGLAVDKPVARGLATEQPASAMQTMRR
jgi:hypothetical protein